MSRPAEPDSDLQVAFACPGCGRPVEGPIGEATPSLACAGCGRTTALADAAAVAAARRVERCPVCGSDDLYAQRDFSRKLGLVVVAVGLGLGPFTSWISVGAAVALDAMLYLVVPSVAICYACDAQVRGIPKENLPGGFEIAVHDAYKFEKRFPPRRELAVAGPRARRLRREGKAP